jgi:hypothetical protein
MNCVSGLFWLIGRGFLTIPKKLFSFLLFPLVYPFRNKIWRSTNAYSQTRWEINKVLKKNKGWKFLVWCFFDDSIYSDFQKDYHPYKHKSKVVEFLCSKVGFCDFLRSWYWAGLRNTSNNLSHYLAWKVGEFQKVIKTCVENKHIVYVIKQFSNCQRPYLEIKIGGLVLNIGWLNNGKFEGPKIRRG